METAGKNGKRCLILDFGGVIVKTMFELQDFAEEVLGLPAGTLTWKGPFAPDEDKLWGAMQRDEITERDYWRTRAREIGELVGEKWDPAAMVGRIRAADPERSIRPEAREVIARAKRAGCVVAVLSNELEMFYGKELLARLSVMRDIDHVVDATHTKILKPDPRAYQLCLEAAGVAAENAVFVDDQLRNAKGAERAGIAAVHLDVRDPAGSFNKAAEILGI